MKGGYKLINCKLLNIGVIAVVIEGIYASVEANNGKSLKLANLVIDGTKYPDAYVNLTKDDAGRYHGINIYGYDISISPQDQVEASVTDVATMSDVEEYVDSVEILDLKSPESFEEGDVITSDGEGGLVTTNLEGINTGRTATEGQVLVADGHGRASFQTLSVGTKLYKHTILVKDGEGGLRLTLTLINTSNEQISTVGDLYTASIEACAFSAGSANSILVAGVASQSGKYWVVYMSSQTTALETVVFSIMEISLFNLFDTVTSL